MTKSMTSGSPMKHILGFAAPLLLGMLFQQFYNMVGSIIVGKLLGSGALAAVGSTGSVNFLVIGFVMGICNGFAIPVAQRFGAQDMTGVRKYVANSVWLCIGFALVMTVLTAVLCRRILTWMQTPEDIFDGAFAYIFVIFLGIPAIFLYNMLSGIIRSLGDSKTPVVFLAISSGLNIVLDILFIVVLHTGPEGAAWATVVAQAVSGVLCLLFIKYRYPVLHISKAEWKFNHRLCVDLCGMGIPMGLQYSITAIGCTVLQAFINQLGTAAVAASSAGNKLGQFFCCPFDAMGSTMATYCGQNVGGQRLERLGPGVRACTILGVIYSAVSLAVLALFAPQLSLLFLDASETQLISMSAQFIIWQAVFYVPLALVNILRFSIQGMGFPQFAILAGVLEMVARCVVGMFFVPAFGYTAACLASPAAWIAADAFLIPACIGCIKRLQSNTDTWKDSVTGHARMFDKAKT